MATTNDELLMQLEDEKKATLSDLEKSYSGMVSEADQYYQDMSDAAQKYADEQTAIQNEQTDLTLSQIEQQKAQAQKDYTREQSAAYVDWQKESNKYGANAEQMAASGLIGSGYHESSQVSMYNTYQNRVAAARESYQQAVLNYDNAMAEARLQNSSVLAEIAYQTLQTQLELSLEGFQYKNQLLSDLSDKKLAVESSYLDTLAELMSEGGAVIDKDEDEGEDDDGGENEPELEFDMESFLELGFGDISGNQLMALIEKGIVVTYEEDGKLKFRRATGSAVNSGGGGGRLERVSGSDEGVRI